MLRSAKVLRASLLSAAVFSATLVSSVPAKAEIFLLKKEKANDWEVSTNGRVDSYLNWIGGSTINTGNSGGLVNPSDPNAIDRYVLVGPQIAIRGNPTPSGAIASPATDTDLNTFRIRGGFASTILAFNIYKQVLPNLKLSVKLALWAGIQNGLNSSNYRQFNDSASVDFREQYMDLSGTWGSVWGGRRIGLFNRGGMKMDWFLVHQHGVGHPCGRRLSCVRHLRPDRCRLAVSGAPRAARLRDARAGRLPALRGADGSGDDRSILEPHDDAALRK